MGGIAFVVEKGRELSGRISDVPGQQVHKSHGEPIRQRELSIQVSI